jgi:hypothetical protein
MLHAKVGEKAPHHCQSGLGAGNWIKMDALTLFGLFAVTMMLVTYALEARSRWYILAFAVACVLGSAYGFMQGAWPFGVVEAIWALVALRRWAQAQSA